MNSNTWLSIIFVAAALVLPLMALRDRRIGASRLLRMGLIWVGIFIAVAVIISAIRA